MHDDVAAAQRFRQLARRQFLSRTSVGIGTAALASLLSPRLSTAQERTHFVPSAKRVICLTQAGAPSQLDLFDFKPKLKEYFGQDLPSYTAGNIDLVGGIDFPDFLTLSANFGKTPGATAAAVPEPTAGVLALVGLLVCLYGRNRR